MKGLNLVASALAVKHTETQTFFFPVDFNRIFLTPVFNSSA